MEQVRSRPGGREPTPRAPQEGGGAQWLSRSTGPCRRRRSRSSPRSPAHRVLSTPQVHAIHSPRSRAALGAEAPGAAAGGRARRLRPIGARATAPVVRDRARCASWRARRGRSGGRCRRSPPSSPPAPWRPTRSPSTRRRSASCAPPRSAATISARSPGATRSSIPSRADAARRRRSLIADAVFTYLREDGEEIAIEQRFLEVDRATLSVDRLAAELARYAELYRAKEAKAAEPLWRARYPVFPPVHLRAWRRPRAGAFAPPLHRVRAPGERPAALAHARGGDLDLPAGGLAARGALRAGLPRRARSGSARRLAREPAKGSKESR